MPLAATSFCLGEQSHQVPRVAVTWERLRATLPLDSKRNTLGKILVSFNGLQFRPCNSNKSPCNNYYVLHVKLYGIKTLLTFNLS